MNSQIFKNPGTAYRGKPFWSWNGKLDEKELLRQARIFKEMGFGGYFLHSRTGLATEYLGEEWFRLTNVVADESKKLGMEAWLYDEDRWPSGSAGGKVTVDESLRMQSLVLHEADPDAFVPSDDVFLAFEANIDADGLTLKAYRVLSPEERVGEFSSKFLHGDSAGSSSSRMSSESACRKIVWFTIEKDLPNSNFNGTTYIDTMNEKATLRFLEMTHEEYLKHCGDRLGTTIPGIFTDEPHRGACMGYLTEKDGVRTDKLFYTDDIFSEFEKRYGYDLRPRLIEVFYRYKGEKVSKPRMDYMDLGTDLFCERFAMPIQKWCQEHGIRFTGHILHEDFLASQAAPNGSLLRFYQYMDDPGIDILTGNNRSYWAAVQCRSVCRQLGKKWMLSELYGATGWEYSLRSHRKLGAWQALFGVNVRCHHLAWYTMEGQCKRDYPASISWHSAYWKYYDKVESFFARLGYLLSLGQPECDLLVIHPIESVWAVEHLGWAKWIFSDTPDVLALEKTFEETFLKLAGSRIDFDYGEEQMLSRMGEVGSDEQGAYLKLGECLYRKVLVSGLLTMRESTATLLKEFTRLGGRLIFAGETPAYVNGLPSDQCRAIEGAEYTDQLETAALSRDSLLQFSAPSSVFSQVRREGEEILFVLMNTEDRQSADFSLCAQVPEGYSLLSLNLENGDRFYCPSNREEGVLKASLHLEAGETAAWLLTPVSESLPIQQREMPPISGILREGRYSYELDEPNVCVLDQCRMKFGDASAFGPLNEVLRVDQDLRDHLGLERRGGEMLQPWFAKDRYQEELGALELEYPFLIDVLPDEPLTFAAERPDEWNYYLNGIKLEPDGQTWLDNAFSTFPVPLDALKTGENVITARCSFRRTTNLEAVYLLGSFGVIAKIGQNRITTPAESLPLVQMEQNRLPFYGSTISLTIPYEQYCGCIHGDAEKILIRIPHFTGTMVTVNDQPILWEPFTAEITEAVREKKALKITLILSRRNTLGPLHLQPVLQDVYGPEHFITQGEAWSDDYAPMPISLGELEFYS